MALSNSLNYANVVADKMFIIELNHKFQFAIVRLNEITQQVAAATG